MQGRQFGGDQLGLMLEKRDRRPCASFGATLPVGANPRALDTFARCSCNKFPCLLDECAMSRLLIYLLGVTGLSACALPPGQTSPQPMTVSTGYHWVASPSRFGAGRGWVCLGSDPGTPVYPDPSTTAVPIGATTNVVAVDGLLINGMARTFYYNGRTGFVDARHLHDIPKTSRLYTCIVDRPTGIGPPRFVIMPRWKGLPPVSGAVQ